ncbi:MAG: ATPase [Proteobacteria bacterium]|nr:ATPase [Pseudomonadota bacterium]
MSMTAEKPKVKIPEFTVAPQEGGFAVLRDGTVLATPAGAAFVLPSKKLAEAVAAEWRQHGKFAAGKMPLTTLAQTGLDRIDTQRELIVESLLVYVDTDALAYRSNSSEALVKRQERDWDPVLEFLRDKLGEKWETTRGVMPIDQSEALHNVIGDYLAGLDSMRLAAACMLSATLSSVALAIAVVEGYISAENAFTLSRLEEEAQAETWGRDPEAEKRAQRIKDEIISAGQFLDLRGTA